MHLPFRLRARTAWAPLAIVAHLCIACGDAADERRASVPDSSVMLDSGTLAQVPADAPFGDTAIADSADAGARQRDAAAAATRPPATEPRTAPADRAAAPDAAPAPAPGSPAVAPESVAITPPVVAPPPTTQTTTQVTTRAEPARMPFEVGERLTYDVKFGPLSVGTATMQVLGTETVRGTPAYHIRFEVRGGNRLYRVEDSYESWFDARTLASLRYVQNIRQGSYRRNSAYEIYPEERRYVENDEPPQPSVAQPLDEGSFIYWMRTIPLEVGKTYTFDNYFKPDRNPVTITVLRRERIKVPAGEFEAIVVQPTIKTRGIFSEGGRAEIWFADDSTRRILQMKSRLSFGSLNLYLK